MWVITSSGFMSAVEKNSTLQVRARDRAALEAWFDADRIMTGEGTDYPFRVHSTHEEWVQVLTKAASEVHYRNFKDEVKKVRGADYAHTLMGVWSQLLKLEPKNVGQLLNSATSWRVPRTTSSYKPAYPTPRHPKRHGRGAPGYFQDTHWGDELELDEAHPWDLEEGDELEIGDRPLHTLTDAEWRSLEGQ